MGELEEVLKGFKFRESQPETYKICLPPKDIAELNCELMKKIGRFEEAEAFQFILDNGLAESFSYESRQAKKYLSASEYVKRLPTKGD